MLKGITSIVLVESSKLERSFSTIKGRKVGDNLYILEGSTVVGTVAVSSSDVGITKLWHVRLWHMSLKGLTILSKRSLLYGETTTNIDFCGHCYLGSKNELPLANVFTKLEEH